MASKLFENKQLIHIATEAVALVGISVYFSQKNKQLMGHMSDISQRIEEQEDIIQKHELELERLTMLVNQMMNMNANYDNRKNPPQRSPRQHRVKRKADTLAPKPPEPQKPQNTEMKYEINLDTEPEQFSPKTEERIYELGDKEELSDSSDDLDKELESELSDLQSAKET